MGGDQQYHVCVQTNLGMHSVNTAVAMTTVPNEGFCMGWTGNLSCCADMLYIRLLMHIFWLILGVHGPNVGCMEFK